MKRSQNKVAARYHSQFAACRELEEKEVGRPHFSSRRDNPIISGQLEYLVQPIYDYYGVAAATAVTKQQLFTLPIGSLYTPAGGSAFAKTLFHTNLVLNGVLDAPKKMLVKAVAIMVNGNIGITDLTQFGSTTLAQLLISGKDYITCAVDKLPGGGGAFVSGAISTQTLAGGGTLASAGANGWPSAENVASITDPMPQIPGLSAMDPILGQLIEQQQNFGVILDPTISGSSAFTTLAASPSTQFVGNGIAARVYLEGVLLRAIL